MQVYYFTRTGRSKKVAEELAERYETKAQEIADDVNWQGAMGYLKAGYESFRKKRGRQGITNRLLMKS